MPLNLHLQEGSFLLDRSLFGLCKLQLKGLSARHSLLHAELHKCSQEHAEVDLNRHHDDKVFDTLDVCKVKTGENPEGAGTEEGGHCDAQEHESPHHPVLAGVLWEFGRAPSARVHVDESVDGVVDVSDEADADGHGQEDHVEVLEDLDESRGNGLLFGIVRGLGNPPLRECVRQSSSLVRIVRRGSYIEQGNPDDHEDTNVKPADDVADGIGNLSPRCQYPLLWYIATPD